MKRTQITVKEVNEDAFRKLKAFAVRGKITVGAALTLAIESLLSQTKKKKKDLGELKAADWGSGTEYLSEQLDETIYGDN